MKKYRLTAFILLVVMIAVPYLAYITNNKMTTEPEKEKPIFDMEISVYRTQSKEVEKIRCYDYICGVVAAEMPANYEAEALKAQTVAAFTYTVNKMNYVKNNPESDIGHNGAFVCDDFSHCKAYLDKDTAKEKWGSSWYNKYYPCIESAVESSLGKIITYNGEAVNAVFHSVSSGKTASAKEIWDSEVSYLQSVECEYDKSAKDFESFLSLSHKEFADKLYSELGITLPQNPSEWSSSITYSESGVVNEFKICDTVLSGTYIRKLFSLRSAVFSFEIKENGVLFTVHGYGHGVGMSQYGANEMAKEGKNCDEILKYFYTGVEIEFYEI